ncbi:MAG: hypothetical protein JSV81_10370 [Anaerolineales bacterium]|nr:MAG: hypothetical protein JSV81_10370 [Anaerolineales bacterium]
MAAIQLRKADTAAARQALRFLRKNDDGSFWEIPGSDAPITRIATADSIWLFGGTPGRRLSGKGAKRLEFLLGGAYLLQGLWVPKGKGVNIGAGGPAFLVKLPAHMAADFAKLGTLADVALEAK